MSKNKINYTGMMTAEKLEIIREVDKKEGSKIEISHAYGFPLSTLLTCLKNWNSIVNQHPQAAQD
jgi:hypothetical protein